MAKALAVVLGASEWPWYSAFEAAPAFKNSATAFRDYLLSEDGLALPPDNILWLFNDESQPAIIIDRIAHFLGTRADETVSDIILFYVGHGAYLNGNYFLALRCTNQNNRDLTILPVKFIAKTLYEKTPDKRHIVIIDACYASGAVKDFIYQTAADAVATIRQEVREILSEVDIARGSALFCAAGPKSPAKAPWESKYTMFSGALQEVLTKGDPNFAEYLSLEDVAGLVERYIFSAFRTEAVRPELHTPRQEAGDIRTLRLFPNFARRLQIGPQWRILETAVRELRDQVTEQSVALQGMRASLDVMLISKKAPKEAPEPGKDVRERVKFLLQNPALPDSAVTYFLSEVLRSGVYAEQATWTIDVDEYKPDLNAYRVRAETEYHYSNMFSDHPVSFELVYGFTPDPFPNIDPKTEIGRYNRIQVGNEDRLKGLGPLMIPRDGLRQKTQVEIAPLGKIVFMTEYVVLMAVGEEQRIRPQKFVKVLSAEIVNHCSTTVRLSLDKRAPVSFGNGREEVVVPFGGEYRPNAAQGISPGEKAFGFTLLGPN
jgi:hypothetical protein